MEMSMDEELESLREKSTRASAVYDDLEGRNASERMEDESGGRFTQQQRLTLAFLVLINVLALACVVLLLMGRLPI